MGVAALARCMDSEGVFLSQEKLSYSAMARHRRCNCKSRQPVALDGVRQERPAEQDADIEAPPVPEAPLDVVESSDRRAASRSRSPRAPRGVFTGIWFDALYATQQEFPENYVEAAAGICDGFYVPHGRLLFRVEQEAWMKEVKEAWKDQYGALIMQMKTGEGKSIVIAMLAVLMCTKFGKKVRCSPSPSPSPHLTIDPALTFA